MPALPAPLPVAGPWEVRFPAGCGAAERITLARLISWSEHPASGVRYFSGTATYRAFDVPAEALAAAAAGTWTWAGSR